jgi:PilZ domain
MARIDHERKLSKDDAHERRRDRRFLASYPAAVSTVFGERRLCMCHDMSSVGGLFLTASKHKPGDAVLLELYINVPGGEPHKTMARVARVQKRRAANVSWAYETAVEFASPTREFTREAEALSERQRSQGLFKSDE